MHLVSIIQPIRKMLAFMQAIVVQCSFLGVTDSDWMSGSVTGQVCAVTAAS